MPRNFKKIYIEITNVCNLQCSFCSVSSKKPGFMPIELFKEILEKIKDDTRYIYLHVKGEPLLHPGLSEILDISYRKKFNVVVVTNGTMIEKSGEMLLSKSALKQVNFSLHCISELGHNFNKEDYLTSILNFTKKALSESSMNISLKLWNYKRDSKLDYPVNDEIIAKIEKEFNFPGNLKDSFEPGKGLKIAERLHLNSDFEFIWPNLNNEFQNTQGYCHALRDHIAILTDGTVVPCCLDSEGIINLGNIRNSSLGELIDSPRASDIKRSFSGRELIEPLCRKCGFIHKFS